MKGGPQAKEQRGLVTGTGMHHSAIEFKRMPRVFLTELVRTCSTRENDELQQPRIARVGVKPLIGLGSRLQGFLARGAMQPNWMS